MVRSSLKRFESRTTPNSRKVLLYSSSKRFGHIELSQSTQKCPLRTTAQHKQSVPCESSVWFNSTESLRTSSNHTVLCLYCTVVRRGLFRVLCESSMWFNSSKLLQTTVQHKQSVPCESSVWFDSFETLQTTVV